MTRTVAVLARVLPESQVDDAVQLLNPDELETFELYASQLETLTTHVTSRPLANTTEAHQLTAVLQRAATARKALEELRDSRVRPLNAEVKAVNGLFATVRDQLDALRARAEKLLSNWKRQEVARQQQEMEEKRRKEQEAIDREIAARAAAEVATTETERKEALARADQALTDQIQAEIDGPREVPKTLKTAGGGSTTIGEVFDLISVERWDLVPDEYYDREPVREALFKVLRAAVKAGARDIPGCNIGPVDRFQVRGA